MNLRFAQEVSTEKRDGKKPSKTKIIELNISHFLNILESGGEVHKTSINNLSGLINEHKNDLDDKYSYLDEEELQTDNNWVKDNLRYHSFLDRMTLISKLLQEKTKLNFRNKLTECSPSKYLGIKKQKNETILSLIFKIGGDGHVIFKNNFGKTQRDQEVLFTLSNPLSSNPANMWEFLVFLVVNMEETTEDLVANLSYVNDVFSKLESAPLTKSFNISLDKTLHESNVTLRTFLKYYKCIPKNCAAKILNFKIQLKFVLGGDWKFLLACVANAKLQYSPFNFRISWFRKEHDLFKRSSVFSPQEILDNLPKLFRFLLRDNGKNVMFSSITTWFRWGDLDLHMVIRLFSGFLQAQKNLVIQERLGTKLKFLENLYSFGVSRSPNDLNLKDIGVMNFYFPKNEAHMKKRNTMKNNVAKEIENAKNTKKQATVVKLVRIQKFEDMVDKFILLLSKLRKDTIINDKKYKQTMNEFSNDFLSFEEVLLIVAEIEELWVELERFQQEFIENAPYYLNFFFSNLIVHISTWFCFKQTSQQTQEMINLIMNNLFRKSNKFGGKNPKEQYYPVFGKQDEKISTNRSLETIITTQNKFQLIQHYKLQDNEF